MSKKAVPEERCRKSILEDPEFLVFVATRNACSTPPNQRLRLLAKVQPLINEALNCRSRFEKRDGWKSKAIFCRKKPHQKCDGYTTKQHIKVMKDVMALLKKAGIKAQYRKTEPFTDYIRFEYGEYRLGLYDHDTHWIVDSDWY